MKSVKVSWSEEDGEYVATFEDYPTLSGLGGTPSGAIGELLEATRAALDMVSSKAEQMQVTFRQIRRWIESEERPGERTSSIYEAAGEKLDY